MCHHVINVGRVTMYKRKLDLLDTVNKMVIIERFCYQNVEDDCRLSFSSLAITVLFTL